VTLRKGITVVTEDKKAALAFLTHSNKP